MKNLSRIIAKVYSEPWLITTAKHYAIQRALEAKLRGETVLVPVQPGDEEEPEEDYVTGETMVIPVHGIIGKHLDMIETMCGGCDLDSVDASIEEARGDSNIRRVAFSFRTPGGTVTGVPETAARIAQLSATKETIAYTDSECCSAGYWMASQCRGFFCAGSASTGSIGVYMALLDQTRALDMQGITVNEISSDKWKCAGAPWRVLSEEERAQFQSQVAAIADDFKSAIGLFRELPDEYMRGQVFSGKDAVAFGLADGIADSLEELLT